MKLGIMQPYFLPYIGYWQLLNAVDNFVIGDNLQYTKKGWMRRNRMLSNGKDAVFSVPVKSGSNYLNINEVEIADPYFEKDADKLFRKITASYMKAPYFEEAMPSVEKCIYCEERNLFDFLFNSVKEISKYLEIDTEITLLSSIDMDHSLKREYKVREICKKQSATMYLNAIGGVELYKSEFFESEGIELGFIKTRDIEYKQFDNEFVPSLSIIDVMMFNSLDTIKNYLDCYDIVDQ
ncbi:MAG: WbqC family protein [Methanolobus sp.]